MKKFIALILTLCLLLCLCAGCAGQADPGSSSEAESVENSAPDKTEGSMDAEEPAPMGNADSGVVWSADVRELMGKPMIVSRLAIAEDGLIYAVLQEYDMEDKINPYLISYDPAAGTVSRPLWEARHINHLAALENGELGVLAQTEDTKYLFRLSTDGEVLFQSPAIPDSGAEVEVTEGYDAYCYNETQTGDLLLYRCATEETTLICAGDGEGKRKSLVCYLSPGGRYVVYIKFVDGLLDNDTAYLYDAETGEETVYPLPTVESDVRSSRYESGAGTAVYFFENDSGKEELTNRCWRVRDGGELEELSLPFQYRNGSGPIKTSNTIILTDRNYDVRQTEASPIYLLDEDGTAYVADYEVPAGHWLSAAAISGDHLVLSIYEGGRDVGDSVYYLIETGFSKIG